MVQINIGQAKNWGISRADDQWTCLTGGKAGARSILAYGGEKHNGMAWQVLQPLKQIGQALYPLVVGSHTFPGFRNASQNFSCETDGASSQRADESTRRGVAKVASEVLSQYLRFCDF